MLTAWLGIYEGLLTNREIAAGLRMRSASHVSKLVRKFDRELSEKPELQKVVDDCVSTLSRKKEQAQL